jgi:hypothetical protein
VRPGVEGRAHNIEERFLIYYFEACVLPGREIE